MQKHYQQVLAATEHSLDIHMRCMIDDPSSPDDGGILIPELGLIHGKSAAIAEPFLLYFNPDSRFYHDPSVHRAALKMLDFTYRKLRPDGTMDLFLANYNSGPDTAFAVIGYAKAYNAVAPLAQTPDEKALVTALYGIIDRCGHALLTNGFHTPNHRWVICAALSLTWKITGDDALRRKIDDYLVEGIDCNDDGEFAERSTGVYNVVNNYALLNTAEQLDKPELLNHAARNLSMMTYYFEPDMSLFTGNSTRQDYGNKVYGDHYFPLYFYMYWKTGEAIFLEQAARIYEGWNMAGRPAAGCLDYYMLYPALKEIELPKAPPAAPKEKLFADSGITRIIRPGKTFTLLRNNPDFFHVHLQKISLFLRASINFFDERHLTAHTIEELPDGSYRLLYTGKGRYLMPLGKDPGTSDWWKMDHSQRETTHHLQLDIEVLLKETDQGLEIDLRSSGCEEVPVKLQWNVMGQCTLYGESFIAPFQPDAHLIIKNGNVRADNGAEGVEIGPFASSHHYIGYLVKGLPPAKGTMQLYSNFVTPFQHKFTIE